MRTGPQSEHLDVGQRSKIRYNWWTPMPALAAKYGVSVKTIVAIRDSRQDGHPAHIAAIARRLDGMRSILAKVK